MVKVVRRYIIAYTVRSVYIPVAIILCKWQSKNMSGHDSEAAAVYICDVCSVSFRKRCTLLRRICTYTEHIFFLWPATAALVHKKCEGFDDGVLTESSSVKQAPPDKFAQMAEEEPASQTQCVNYIIYEW